MVGEFKARDKGPLGRESNFLSCSKSERQKAPLPVFPINGLLDGKEEKMKNTLLLFRTGNLT